MSVSARTRFAYTLFVCLGVAALTLCVSLPMRAQEVPLKKQLRGRQRLLRKIYVNAPDTDVKGLAASIKADEITVKHRIHAIRYLATVDSVAYPEAKEMLIDRLHNDRWEEVRFEAAKALRLMMAGNADGFVRNRRLFRMWFRRWRRHTRRSFRTRVRGRYDFRSNPCDPMTLNALVRTAYELDEDNFCFEPSRRVRQMAVLAIRASGVVCDVGPYMVSSEQMRLSSADTPLSRLTNLKPTRAEKSVARSSKSANAIASTILPSDFESNGADGRVVPIGAQTQDGFDRPGESDEWQLVEDTPTDAVGEQANPLFQIEEVASVSSPLTTPAPCLNGYCPVGLWYEQTLPALPEFSTVYQERLYRFSSAAAKKQFEGDPERFAVAYGGFDPVAYASSQTLVDGRVLREFDGHFYAFASQENWEEFVAESDLYVLHPGDLLSNDEYRTQAIEEFKAIEAELSAMDATSDFDFDDTHDPQRLQMDSNGAARASDFELSDAESATNPGFDPGSVDEQESELSYGVLEFNEAEIADFGGIQLSAPPPAAGDSRDQEKKPPVEFIDDGVEMEPIGEPDDVLSEIEKILGVRKRPDGFGEKMRADTTSTRRTAPEKSRVQTANAEQWVAPWDDRTLITRVQATDSDRRTKARAERLRPLTTPIAKQNKPASRGWSSLITNSEEASRLPTPNANVVRSSLPRKSPGQMRVYSITRGAQTKRRRPASSLKVRTPPRSSNSVLQKRLERESTLRQMELRQPLQKVQQIVPRSSRNTSLQMRSNPSKVTTITKRR